MRLGFVTWADESPTGGNTYNRELISALRARGIEVTVHKITGSWPPGSPDDHGRLAAVLAEPVVEPLTIVDGIVASGAPAVIESARGTVVILLHMSLIDHPDAPPAYEAAERRALAAAAAVIVPSQYAASELSRRYGVTDAIVARPGSRPQPIATGSTPPRLLCLGAISGIKDQLTFVRALASLDDLAFGARVVGSTTDPYAELVAAERGRAELAGVRTGGEMAAEWAATDLLVHCARSETYGLVVAEAHAHGIPAVVVSGTGAAEALAAGAVVQHDELVPTLRRWLTDPALRAAWRESALRRRERAPGWDATAAAVLADPRCQEFRAGGLPGIDPNLRLNQRIGPDTPQQTR